MIVIDTATIAWVVFATTFPLMVAGGTLWAVVDARRLRLAQRDEHELACKRVELKMLEAPAPDGQSA